MFAFEYIDSSLQLEYYVLTDLELIWLIIIKNGIIWMCAITRNEFYVSIMSTGRCVINYRWIAYGASDK